MLKLCLCFREVREKSTDSDDKSEELTDEDLVSYRHKFEKQTVPLEIIDCSFIAIQFVCSTQNTKEFHTNQRNPHF